MQLSREQVIGYRVAAQGLHREAGSVAELGVLDIGVQEAMGHSASVIFGARLPDVAAARPPVGPGHRLALAWTLRGAPHVHRRADLDRMAAALWPLSEADATVRLNETGPSIARKGLAALDQFTAAVEAMRAVVREPTAKGAASGAVTARLPEAMWRDCRPCGTRHISDSAMRAAAPAAGLELEPGTSPPVLLPRPKATLPGGPDRSAVAGLARDYLTHLGPATVSEVAGYLGARRADVQEAWPASGLTEVEVEGRAAWLPDAAIDAAREAPAPELVRLLGPFDPYLQARDRLLIVPDKAVHKALWPVLGRPGAVFADGEIVGTWRTRGSGRTLTITVDAFAPLPAPVWDALEAEAERVAALRDLPDVRVLRSS